MAEVEDKLKDYEIKKEGEAEILMLKSNAVFFNPVQVSWRSYFFVCYWHALD
jgi:tRNA (guanine26-N2/guanine27-N2)-dimethyltransferase